MESGSSRSRFLLGIGRTTGVRVGLSKRVWPQSLSVRLPTLRFRGKIMLGFAVVLAISAASMGIAYLGFERVSAGVAFYRNSVPEAALAPGPGIPRLYQDFCRYYQGQE